MLRYTLALGMLLTASAASANVPFNDSIIEKPSISAHLVKKVTPENQIYDEDSDDEATVVKAKIASQGKASSGFLDTMKSAWGMFVSFVSSIFGR